MSSRIAIYKIVVSEVGVITTISILIVMSERVIVVCIKRQRPCESVDR